MTLRRCIANLSAAGQLDAGRAAEAQAVLDDLERAYIEAGMDPTQAAIAASPKALDALDRAALEKRRQALLQTNVQQTILANLTMRGDDWHTTALAHFDLNAKVTGVSNIDARARAVRGQAHSRMADVLATFKQDLRGRTGQPAMLDNLAREAFGENTGDAAARELARAWTEATEWLRQRFNAAGGTIAKRADWGLPQTHDMLKVRKAGFEAWRSAIAPRLDRGRMIDERTGLPFSAESFELMLREVFETIRSDGMNKVTPSGAAGGRKLANRRSDSRFLIFKSADDWLAYNRDFGAGEVWDVMMGHVDSMARDIAQLEILGPNPTATLRWLQQTVKKHAVELDNARGGERYSNAAARANGLMAMAYDSFTGSLNAPVNPVLARSFNGFRAWQTASKLGSAMLSAVTDVGFGWVTAKFNDLPYLPVISRQLSLLDPTNAGDRKLAVRLGLIAEEWAHAASALNRYGDEVHLPGIAQRLSSGVLRASGLSAWTQAGKWAFGMELLGHLADQAGRRFDELEDGVRLLLERYGFNRDSWDVLRATPMFEHEGARFLRPDDVAARTDLKAGLADDLATRLLELVQTESRFATPEATLLARATLAGGLQSGTVTGELVRSATQFKAFPVSILFTHVLRALYTKGSLSRPEYVANLFIATTVMGALSLQLKQIAAGKDPQDMTAPAFWGAAVAQGGGAGLLGDFLFSDQNRYGGSLAETLAGPLVGTASDVLKLTVGNAREALAGKDTHAGRELVRFLKANTPGSSLWYARVALDRILWDQMQKELDPDYRESFRAIERRARREFDQGYWWRPGDLAPEAAPDILNMAGAEE